jgi:hypothetical protein
MELFMIYKISPNPSLPKRGKQSKDFSKGERLDTYFLTRGMEKDSLLKGG